MEHHYLLWFMTLFTETINVCYSATLHKCSTKFPKIWSHLHILDVRSKTWRKFHAENPQFRSDPWNSLLSGNVCSVHVKWWTTIPGNYAEDYRCHHKKFSHSGNQTPRICTSLLWNSLTSYVCCVSSFTPLPM